MSGLPARGTNTVQPVASVSRSPIFGAMLVAAIAAAACALAMGDASRLHAGDSSDEGRVGQSIEPFELLDFRGKSHRPCDAKGPVIVIAFLGVECPLARLYASRLQELADTWSPRGVAFFGVNSNSQDSLTELAAYARSYDVRFPLLKDPGNRIADLFGAERTPEVFVLDRERRVRYQGRIDDQYGVGLARDRATRELLGAAIEELIAGREVTTPYVAPMGCHIGRVKEPDADSSVTYSNQVARILQRHCVECHRPGEIAPFALTEYGEVAGWADTIEEVIRDQRMPPWHAAAEHDHFKNSRRMSDDEKETIYRWVAAGAPEGDAADLPPPAEFVEGWRLSQPPDQIVAMRDQPFVVPAEGTVEYQYFVVDPGFTEDKWIHAAEVIPGNRSVVHHAIVFFRTPEHIEQRGIGWLTAYVPGQSFFDMPPSQARRVPAGSKFVFQMHYTPNGSPQEDTTRIGLVFSDPEEVREELLTLAALNHDLEIPPHASNHPITANLSEFPDGAKLLAIAPHMHVRGKSFRVEAVETVDSVARDENASSAGSARGSPRTTLLDVPHYDFNWQHAYVLEHPLLLTDAVRLECSATFDNSAGNLVNPDPSERIFWGDQTWEEMMIAFFEVAVPLDRSPNEVARSPSLSLSSDSSRGIPTSRRSSDVQPLDGAALEQAERLADDLLKRFDADGDGVIRRDDVPEAFGAFAFGRIDRNRDQQLTRDEAFAEAERTIRRRRRESDRP